MAMPFHSTIDEYVEQNPKFKNQFKIYKTTRFSPLGVIIISGVDAYPDDEVIGIFSLERSKARRSERTFIQDYLVWHKANDSFTHYTTTGQHSNLENVKHIHEFWKKYGQEKYYGTTPESPLRGDHWYNEVDDLPIELRGEARRVLERDTVE